MTTFCLFTQTDPEQEQNTILSAHGWITYCTSQSAQTFQCD